MSSTGRGTSPWPQPADLTPLWRTRRDDARAREALVHHFLPYARMQAARLFAGRPGDELDFGDYFQFATVALTEAVDSFDPSRETRFETYAAYRIRGAVLDGVASMSERQRQIATTRELRQARLKSLLHVPPTPLPDAETGAVADAATAAPRKTTLFPKGSALERLSEAGLGLAIGLMLEGTGLIDPGPEAPAPVTQMPYARMEMRQQREQLLGLMRQLPEPQRQVMEWHYLQGHPFDALAARAGLSKGRISQLHRAALDTLRRRLDGVG
jgi:RNA polymerase sigma factor FliA